MTRYQILGGLTLRRGNGDRVTLPAGVVSSLLAVLVLNVGRLVTKEELIRAVWGGGGAPEAQLHKAVNALRRLLETRDDLTTSHGNGYRLEVAPQDLDLLEFGRLVAAGDVAHDEGRIDDEIDLLRTAEQLWHGPQPLTPELYPSLSAAIDHLLRKRRRVLARLAHLYLQRRDYFAVVDLLCVDEHVLSDDNLCSALMLAHFWLGEPATALDRFRRRVAQVAPASVADETLRALAEAIAAEDVTAVEQIAETVAPGTKNHLLAASPLSTGPRTAGMTSTARQPEPATIVPRELPLDVKDLVGREHAIDEAQWLLQRQSESPRVLVISGMGGVGKTALAVRIAHGVAPDYPDGQLFLTGGWSSQPRTSHELLAQALASLGAESIPDEEPRRAALFQTLTATRRLLMVIDDAVDEDQVRALIPNGPACATLITSRRRLPDLSTVHHLPQLQSLDLDSATELIRRALRQTSASEPDADSLTRLARLCNGLPLALRIAGALAVAEGLSANELADRIAEQGSPALTYRSIGLVRLMDAQLARLNADARQLLLGLSTVELTGFGHWVAAAQLDRSWSDAVATVGQLVAQCLISPADASVPRFRFHPLVLDYCRRRAETEFSPGQRNMLAERTYRMLVVLVQRAGSGLDSSQSPLTGPDGRTALPPAATREVDGAPDVWIRVEWGNVLAAERHCLRLNLTDLARQIGQLRKEYDSLLSDLDSASQTKQLPASASQPLPVPQIATNVDRLAGYAQDGLAAT